MQSQQAYTTVNRPGDNSTFVAPMSTMSAYHFWGKTPDQARGELIDVVEIIQQEYEGNERSLPENIYVSAEEERYQLR
jgi:tRNA A37 threonylcarbamoyltransferase TsaD